MWNEESDWIGSFDALLARLAECSMCSRRSGERPGAAQMDVKILDVAAEGGYGRVFRCLDVHTGALVAMKQITMVRLSQGIPAQIIREVSLLRELHHANIVKLLRVGFTENRYVNLVFEHLDYDLHQFIVNRGYPKDATTVKSFMFQILSAVAYCHSRKVLHRDLKPSNVLINHSKRLIKLADFGLAREFADDFLYTEKLGTSWYRAPEILCHSRQYSTQVDLWSVGCIFAEMVIGQPLFQVINCRDELEGIFKLLGTPTEETWPGITKLMPNLHIYCSKFDPLGLETFVTDLEPSGLNLLSMMLCLDPSKRISAEASLKHAYFTDVNWVSLLLL
ncbi:Cell division control protein 2 [Glycine soja]|uniref:Cell division control protein 2-like isoform A n=1 Tax=Glycine soja TaxID=3848 RepID=A0A445GWC0_GLYSO|nr:Cell division control protein 2 [Glycine max]RZB65591.1 Cell division control protein 2-like isoform A [Glycine soja]